MKEMRTSLKWSLIASATLSVVALYWPERNSRTVVAVERALAPQSLPSGHQLTLATQSTNDAQLPGLKLPNALPRPELDPPKFDPFVGAQSPTPTAAPAPAPAPTPFVGPTYEPPPPPPPMAYRYLGQMTDPSRQRRVYLSAGSNDVLVSVGTRLDGGYVVEAITADAVRLHYPPLGTRVSIPIPTPDDSVVVSSSQVR
jgi:hypothetical protein